MTWKWHIPAGDQSSLELRIELSIITMVITSIIKFLEGINNNWVKYYCHGNYLNHHILQTDNSCDFTHLCISITECKTAVSPLLNHGRDSICVLSMLNVYCTNSWDINHNNQFIRRLLYNANIKSLDICSKDFPWKYNKFRNTNTIPNLV